MKATHEHEWEAAPGLPEPLPSNERVLWQGRPDAWRLAIEALHVRKVAVYFALLLLWQQLSLQAQAQTLNERLHSLVLSTALALVPLALLALTAWWSARTTLYTVTNRRVVMRIGIVLSLTLNLPYRQLRAAHLRLGSGGHGDIALELPQTDRIGWFHLWPHQRAWRLRHPQPTLRCLAQAQPVGDLILQQWQQSLSQGLTSSPISLTTDPAPSGWPSQQPAQVNA